MPPPWTPRFGSYHSWIDEGTFCVIVVDAAADPTRRGDHGRLVSAMHDLHAPDAHGQVTPDERPALDALDAEITARLERTGGDPWLVGRRIERGRRYLFWYLADDAAKADLTGEWPGGYAPRWFAQEDPGWQEFADSLAPTPLQRALLDAGPQLDELARLGDDHEAERPVDHTVVFPSADAARAGADALRDAGFAVAAADARPAVTGTRSHAVDVWSLEPVLERVFAAVAPFDGAYDGWGAPVAGEATNVPDAPSGRRRRFWRR
ncbi:ribonuclease E inhibitor RraB [Patulibacter sp. S7RM1-6]